MTTTYDAAGNVATTVNPLGNTTTYTYDNVNRLETTKDALAGVTTYLYDALGNRTGIIDASNNRTTWVFDELHRVTTETDPKNESATFAYDAIGQLTSSTDRLGKRTDFTYDGESRKLTEKWYNFGGSLVQTQTFTYDAVGNILTAGDPDGTYTMTYDALNRTTRVDGFFGVVLTFSYDAVGNRTQVEDNKSSGKGIFTSTYDAANQLTRKEVTWGTAVEAATIFTYHADGQLQDQVMHNALVEERESLMGGVTYTYDSSGRVHNILHWLYDKDDTIIPFGNLTYTYDVAHRALTEVTNGATKTYTYDVVDQLTADSTATFTYDATGNRNNGSYSTSAANETTTDGTWTYTYDDAGQRTAKSKGASAETWVYEYDHDGHLTLIEKRNTAGGAAVLRIEYAYDAFGNRISRVQSISGASTERYVVDGWKTNLDPLGNTGNFIGQENWDVVLDLNSSNAVTQRRMFGNNVDQVLGRMNGFSGPTWYREDRQGSVRWVTTKDVTGTLTYDGFGRILTSTGSVDRYSYTGREYDTGTATTGTGGEGLLHLRDRMLALDMGKFITRDRLGFDAGDTNLVRYVGNGYTNASDPSGQYLVTQNESSAQEMLRWLNKNGVHASYHAIEGHTYNNTRYYIFIATQYYPTLKNFASSAFLANVGSATHAEFNEISSIWNVSLNDLQLSEIAAIQNQHQTEADALFLKQAIAEAERKKLIDERRAILQAAYEKQITGNNLGAHDKYRLMMNGHDSTVNALTSGINSLSRLIDSIKNSKVNNNKYSHQFRVDMIHSRGRGEDVDMLFKIAAKTGDLLSNKPVGAFSLAHSYCGDWVEMFYRLLNASALKGSFGRKNSLAINGITNRKLEKFFINIGATGNPVVSVNSAKYACSLAVHWGLAFFPDSWLNQDHVALKLTLNNGSVWYVDCGMINKIITGSGSINSVDSGAVHFTPESLIPKDWIVAAGTNPIASGSAQSDMIKLGLATADDFVD